MLSTNILLIYNFIKCYQTALILNFIVNQKINQLNLTDNNSLMILQKSAHSFYRILK